MRVLPALFFISALAPVTYTFEFTAPDTSKPVNLSEPVVLKWPIVGGNPPQPWLQLIFATGDSFQVGRWGINVDLIDTRNDSTWTWDAPQWVEDVNPDGFEQILVGGKNNWFEASLSSHSYSNQSWSLNPVATEKFEIVGYPHLRNPNSGAGAMMPSLSLALAAGAIVLICGLIP
ncbi:hypothetical protein B0J13DRAFT_617262 [Dactylonectria estremocensis]|uniref:Uncharacterized protein n=1 Tax=Dactylonectria estremocensis TaxID=1079267 RepID=A0A9P9FFG5_9HYPO|nr:hypothetical protein B0J13DRAFT_617262 [Dactylonectria estremocensis]